MFVFIFITAVLGSLNWN